MHAEPHTMSNLQLELLKLYAHNVDEQDLLAIRQLIGLYFAEKASTAMDAFIEEKELTPLDIANWAYEHWRSKARS
jgi:hypothetical protein